VHNLEVVLRRELERLFGIARRGCGELLSEADSLPDGDRALEGQAELMLALVEACNQYADKFEDLFVMVNGHIYDRD